MVLNSFELILFLHVSAGISSAGGKTTPDAIYDPLYLVDSLLVVTREKQSPLIQPAVLLTFCTEPK